MTEATDSSLPASTGARPPLPRRAATLSFRDREGADYRLIRRLGEGGFGEVWLAEQEGALQRSVAVKLFKPGLHPEAAISRFHAERRLLAVLDHPGIATVFDAGVTGDGRPFYVMEYVDGLPLGEFCAQRQPGVRGRVELIAEVCDAVQHAHQRTVLHRDLKPANVLVRQDGADTPAVKVIDFGIGKAIGDELMERTLWTMHGEVLGTPDYMSPEQAEGDPARIDVRTDIFSIGAMLYELLSGCTPLQALRRRHPECRQAGFLTVSHALPGLTAVRRLLADAAEPAGLGAPLRQPGEPVERDLEAVVMKACEVEMERRYASVAELADDLRRWQEMRPVHARPQTTAYRFGKFARRRPGLVLGGTALLLVLTGWAGTGYLLASRAESSRREALRERDQAEARRLEAEAAEKAAQQAQNEAKASADLLLEALSGPRSNSRGLEVTVIEVLDDAARRVRENKQLSAALRATMLHNVGSVQFHYQRYREGLDNLEEALRLRRLLLGPGDPLTIQAGVLVGRCCDFLPQRARAVPLLEQILAEAEKSLGREHPVTNEARNYLGVSLYYAKAHARAVEVHQANLAIRRRLHGADHPLTLSTVDDLSANLAETGRLREAYEMLEAAMPKILAKVPPSNAKHTIVPARMAAYCNALGRPAEALTLAGAAVESACRIYGPVHHQSAYAYSLKLEALIRLRRPAEITATCADYAARVERVAGLLSPEQLRSLPVAVARFTNLLESAGQTEALGRLKALAERGDPAAKPVLSAALSPVLAPRPAPDLVLDLAAGAFADCRPGLMEDEVVARLREHGIDQVSRGQDEADGNYRLKLPAHPCMDFTFRSDGVLLRIHWANRQPSVVLPAGLAAASLTRKALEERYGASLSKPTNQQGRLQRMIPMGGHEIWFDHDPQDAGHVHTCAIRSPVWLRPGKP